jgi:hypothetical protein
VNLDELTPVTGGQLVKIRPTGSKSKPSASGGIAAERALIRLTEASA